MTDNSASVIVWSNNQTLFLLAMDFKQYLLEGGADIVFRECFVS